MTLLPWQQQNWAHLQAYIGQQRIPQALLIIGNKGLGKAHLAHQFAMAVLCLRPQANGLACGACSRCLLVSANTHPDFIQIQPKEPGKSITIEQIRNLIGRLTLKPQFDSRRLVIVNPAEMMNNAAANAFLKCLEEPTERTSIILVSEKPGKLPATIVSRCQKLTIAMPERAAALLWLVRAADGDGALNDSLPCTLSLAQGAPLLALEYVNDQKTLVLRNSCFADWVAVAEQRKSPVAMAEDWHKQPASALIFWITSWVIDLIKCRYSSNEESLYNPDLAAPLQALAARLEIKGLYKLYDLLLASRQRLDTPINKQLLFEEIIIQWQVLNRSQYS